MMTGANMWVKFTDQKPVKGSFVITRFPGKPGSCFEDHREWNPQYLKVKPKVTHWWIGDPDFDQAIEEWKK